MPRYELLVHTTAERELSDLDREDRERLTDTITAVAEQRQPTSHDAVRPLEGQPNVFRVRVGDVRAVCQLEKPNLLVLRVGYRKNVYDGIDDVVQQRASA